MNCAHSFHPSLFGVRADLCYANDLLVINDLRQDSEVIAANIEDDQAFDVISAIEGPFQVDQVSPLGCFNLFDPFSKWNSGISVLGDEFVGGSAVLDYHSQTLSDKSYRVLR
jgi:hypothetical protein